jgi:glycosyltransferase involved in cell wall biosynthesis
MFTAIAHELARRGHRVVILVDKRRTDLVNHTTNPAVVTWASPRPTRLADGLFLYRLTRQYRPDCYVANFGAINWMMIIGSLMNVRIRIAWSHTLTAQIDADAKLPPWKIALLRLRRRFVFGAATLHVANSEAAKRDLMQAYGVPESKAATVYYSIDDPLLELGSLPPKRDGLIVCVGRLDASKGQDVLIRAASLLRRDHPDLPFTVELVGTGDQMDGFKALTAELGVAQHVQFVGSLPHEDVFRRMAEAVVTVVPSRSEAFGLVNVESLSVSTPVIASAVGGIPEIVRNGVDGFLIPPDDPVALAEKLHTLLTDHTIRERLSKNARERFVTTFEHNGAIERIAGWLEGL